MGKNNPRPKFKPVPGFGMYHDGKQFVVAPMAAGEDGRRPSEFEGFEVRNWSNVEAHITALAAKMNG